MWGLVVEPVGEGGSWLSPRRVGCRRSRVGDVEPFDVGEGRELDVFGVAPWSLAFEQLGLVESGGGWRRRSEPAARVGVTVPKVRSGPHRVQQEHRQPASNPPATK